MFFKLLILDLFVIVFAHAAYEVSVADDNEAEYDQGSNSNEYEGEEVTGGVEDLFTEGDDNGNQ